MTTETKRTRTTTDSWLLSLAVGGFIGLVILSWLATAGYSQSVDEAIMVFIYEHTSGPVLDMLTSRATELAGPTLVPIAITAVIAYFLYKRQHRRAAFVGIAIIGSTIAHILLKFLFERARPDLWQHIVLETSYSFPSGHATASASLASIAVIMLWRTRYRRIAIVAGILFMIIIGFTRLYLGVHYPTDVIAGWSLGIAWSALIVLVARQYNQARRGQPQL